MSQESTTPTSDIPESIEVELRGPLETSEFDRLMSFCESNGRFLGRENRFLVDYSTFIEGIGTRELDVRVRITNGRAEIVAKKGAFGGPSRSEAVVRVQDGDPTSAFRLMALLGYRRGVACDRGIGRYVVDGIEIALQDVRIFGNDPTIHSRFFEVELLASRGSMVEAESRLRSFVSALRLRLFSETDWNEYVQTTNMEANGVFDIDACGLDVIAARRYGRSPE